MGHKVFVSYKYADSDVRHISDSIWTIDTVRTYVDKLADYITDTSDHIYKGENDGEDLSALSDGTIWAKLKDKIYDSTLTIVMISKGMKEAYHRDRDQWIPWEISYSLKEVSRKTKNGTAVTSSSNAILAVVLPDRNGSYSYYTEKNICCRSGCRTLKTYTLFDILKANMFNRKNPDSNNCDDGRVVYHGESSYILSVTWDDFVLEPETYIDRAYSIQKDIEMYDIKKEV